MAVELSNSLAKAHLDPAYIAYFWRGTCLDHFSKGERVVSDCIEAIRESGGALDKESTHPGSAARSRSLVSALKTQTFGGHQKAAIRRLEDWIRLCERRPGLAHGLFKITKAGVTITLSEYLAKERRDHPPMTYTFEEMRSFLADLEECVHHLVGQMGQIQAFCRKNRS